MEGATVSLTNSQLSPAGKCLLLCTCHPTQETSLPVHFTCFFPPSWESSSPIASPQPFYWETTGQTKRRCSNRKHHEEYLSRVSLSPGYGEQDPSNVTVLTVKGSERAAEYIVGGLPATSVGDWESTIHLVSACAWSAVSVLGPTLPDSSHCMLKTMVDLED